jgi:hypothetical protein
LTIKLTDILGNTKEQKVVLSKGTKEPQFIEFNHTSAGVYNLEVNDCSDSKLLRLMLTQD